MPTLAMLSTGEQIGRYKIRSAIGKGGMGEVFLADDTELERLVALKVLPANLANDPERMRRFVQEAKSASALNHPNIITIYEIGKTDNTHFIATEYIEGETLHSRLVSEPLNLKSFLDIAIQIASALDAAHRAGIIHRDIKPENVMIRPDGVVKILDFGIAKLTEKKAKSIEAEAATAIKAGTSPGTIIGTAAYMSPEQARGKGIDARSDIFSFGVVLYEMLTRKQPFEGENALDVIGAILNKEPAPLNQIAPDIPRELQHIVEKSLRKDREERYQTTKDLFIDLKDIRQELEIQNKLERTASPNREEAKTKFLNVATEDASHPTSSVEYIANESKGRKGAFAIGLIVLLLGSIGLGYWYIAERSVKPIDSIAVLPFVNESGSADTEYLSDGMTETLIGSLSQIPKLNVKARSSVFRYKGKETDVQIIGRELNVQAILNGRVIQRGQDLILYVELVDTQTENSLWKQTYNKTMTNLVALQNDIARDVADKLKVKLSGADEQKLAKNYTANTEAYQLYLRGRFHVYKLTPPEVNKGISYFQKAIAIDPNYALAYAGLSDAYRSLALGGEMLPTEFLPKAKMAANQSIRLDDTLSEAHTTLGMNIFWYDWDWTAAENQFKRALEINPNDSNAHLFYAHLLSNTGRHTEALAEVKRAQELDPLSPFANALEGQFLIHAGRTDEALDGLRKSSELEPNFWMSHLFASSAYIEKGMHTEAVAEARKARSLSPALTISVAYSSYALAKSGNRTEAQAMLKELLKMSTERFVPPTHIALIYNGLGEREETLAWLERGFEQRDPKMTFLKVEPKWNNLRNDPRFQNLVRRVGLPQ